MGKKYSRKSTNQFAKYGISTGRDSLRGNKTSSEYGIRVIDKKTNTAKQEYPGICKVIYERRNANRIHCLPIVIRSHQNILNSIVYQSRHMISLFHTLRQFLIVSNPQINGE